MYILNQGKKYTCVEYDSTSKYVAFTLTEALDTPLVGKVGLYQDGGLLLVEHAIGDYTRQTLDGVVLTLTNLPEPMPEPESLFERLTVEDVAVAILDMQVEMINLKMGVN